MPKERGKVKELRKPTTIETGGPTLETYTIGAQFIMKLKETARRLRDAELR